VEFRILGPLEVIDGSGPVALGRLKERLVLAVLLLHAGEAVSRERLIDELWGESPPPTARKAVNVYVSELRKRLAGDGEGPIATVPGGYRLDVDHDGLDAARMRHLVATAREAASAGEPGAAAELYRQALGLWRGDTLAGLQLESVGRHEIEQLEALRLAALMDRIDCDLALGRHEQLIGELNILVSEHPLRERLRAQQMLALYRADRQADALEAYADARRTLVDELGIEPSPALQRLQKGVLAHDPALEIPAGIAVRNGPEPPAPVAPPAPPAEAVASRRARFHPRPRYVALAVLATLAVAGGLTAFATRASGHHAPAPRVQANSLVQLDPATGKVVSVLPVGLEPGPIVATSTALWIVNRGDQTVARYDLRTHTVHTTGSFASAPYDIAADTNGNVWVSGRQPVVTWILRSASGTGTSAVPLAKQTINVPLPGAGAEAVGAGYLWVVPGPAASSGNDRVSLIDVRNHGVASSISLGRQTTALAFGYGSAWIGTYDRGGSSDWLSVVRAGSSTGESIGLESADGTGPLDVAVGAGSVWVLTSSGTLVRVDPETRRVLRRLRIVAGKEPVFVAVGGGFVWTANLEDFSVSQIDPHTDRVVRTIPLGSYTQLPCGLAVTRDAVWVTIGDSYCDSTNR
jgi:DNA-binding SARP family transcriptional activator/streptogramin lyase